MAVGGVLQIEPRIFAYHDNGAEHHGCVQKHTTQPAPGKNVLLPLYAAMMLCTIVVIGKDTRLDLQYATNRHIRSAMLCLFTYVVFAISSVPAARFAGGVGIAVAWAAVEIVQMALMHSENREVVPALTYGSLLKLCLCGLAALAVFVPLERTLAVSNLSTFFLSMTLVAAGLVVCTSFLFGLPDLIDQFGASLRAVRTRA